MNVQQPEPDVPEGASPTNRTQTVSWVGMVTAALPGVAVLFALITKREMTHEEKEGLLSLAVLGASIAAVLGNLGSILAKQSAFRWLKPKGSA